MAKSGERKLQSRVIPLTPALQYGIAFGLGGEYTTLKISGDADDMHLVDATIANKSPTNPDPNFQVELLPFNIHNDNEKLWAYTVTIIASALNS